MESLKTYLCWARTGKNEKWVLTEGKGNSAKEVKEYLIGAGYEIDGRIYLKK